MHVATVRARAGTDGKMLKLAITALAACAAVMRSVHAQTCDASKSNRERTEDKIVLRCAC